MAVFGPPFFIGLASHLVDTISGDAFSRCSDHQVKVKVFKHLFPGLFTEEPVTCRGAPDARAYGVGDIHGRLDLLEDLLAAITRNSARRVPRKTYLVFLGDLIDRGPDLRGVVERLRGGAISGMIPIFLMGNHEEVMLRILEHESGVLWNWLKFGGAECVESYGLDPFRLSRMQEKDALRLIEASIPLAHRAFIAAFADTFSFGDYLFVHAGIRPGRPLEEQRRQDLRWIREPFLTEPGDLGHVVVHGHTVVDAVEEYDSRIAIDTGAYRSGILTAIGIEDDRRWYLSTGGEVPAAAAD